MSMDLLTLADAREFVRPSVDGGSCDLTRIDSRIAEAEQRLLTKADWRLSLRRVRIQVQNCCFPLPLEVEKILHFNVDSVPGVMHNRAIEFLQAGPGDVEDRRTWSGMKNLKDEGEFATMFDIPVILTPSETSANIEDTTSNEGYVLAAFSEYAEDIAAGPIKIKGTDKTSDEIYTDQSGVWQPGEELTINRWSAGVEGNISGKWTTDIHVTTSKFRAVSQVYKPTTKGPICLYAVDTTTNQMWFLSKMIPEARIPYYRRYRIMGSTSNPCLITALVKVRFRRATRADDVLTIQNLPALKAMIIAIGYENQKALAPSREFEFQALSLLKDEKENREVMSGTPVVIDMLKPLSARAYARGYRR